jgi:hypothetical protein
MAPPRKRDTATPDLFRDYVVPTVVERFAPERMRAATVTMRVARAIAEALKNDGRSRADIAREMSTYLGDTVTEAMLNQYASPSNDKHNIPAHRLLALLAVTGDARLINALLEDAGLIAVSAKYEVLIRRELAKEARERLDREIAATDAQWRAGR